MDQRTRKIRTMHKALHPRDNVDRVYVSRREGERGLASIENSVDTSIKRLEDYTEKRRGRLIIATRNNTNGTRTSGTTITRKQNWEEKQFYGSLADHRVKLKEYEKGDKYLDLARELKKL